MKILFKFSRRRLSLFFSTSFGTPISLLWFWHPKKIGKKIKNGEKVFYRLLNFYLKPKHM
jgi:hypothetical protein